MDVNKIKVLLQAVDNGSLLMTAKQLGYTQAGLTHMMNSIENELGITLLHRGKFGVKLTEEGERMMPLFRQLVSASEKIEGEAALILEQKASIIRLGAIASVIRTWLPDAIRSFQQENPEISFEIKEVDERLYEIFDKGRLDLCITSNIMEREDFIPLIKDEFFAVLPPDYPLDESGVFPLRRIEDENFLFPSAAGDYDVEQTLEGYGIKVNKQSTSVDDNSALSMAARGFGVSLLPKLLLDNCHENVKIAPLDKPCFRRIGMLYNQGKNASPGAKKFAAFLRGWFGTE